MYEILDKAIEANAVSIHRCLRIHIILKIISMQTATNRTHCVCSNLTLDSNSLISPTKINSTGHMHREVFSCTINKE
ncbi:hypothetical protein OIU84_002818 [Salix udensis]|uniref:Uncharacterized protein n=1 Tax=Salix udensis TaxID=889485 RepID=A0AAD6K539_9ROSI|nr:hypothetical protein OIU84_002818 [Salix udensis]